MVAGVTVCRIVPSWNTPNTSSLAWVVVGVRPELAAPAFDEALCADWSSGETARPENSLALMRLSPLNCGYVQVMTSPLTSATSTCAETIALRAAPDNGSVKSVL